MKERVARLLRLAVVSTSALLSAGDAIAQSNEPPVPLQAIMGGSSPGAIGTGSLENEAVLSQVIEDWVRGAGSFNSVLNEATRALILGNLFESGDPIFSRNFLVFEWTLGERSSAARSLAELPARVAAGADPLAAVVRKRQDLEEQSRRLERRIEAAPGLHGTWRDMAGHPLRPLGRCDANCTVGPSRPSAVEVTLAREWDRLRKERVALDARIARDFPRYAELTNPQPLSLEDAQALLAPSEVMLVYFVGDKESWLWALRNDRAQSYKLDIGRMALSDDVAALRQRLQPDLNPDLAPFDVKRAYELYEKIVAPAAPLLDGANGIFVVPDRALESLPFEVLVTMPPTANPQTAADHRVVAWLARKYAITVLPSAGSLKVLRQFSPPSHAVSPFVGVGDPVLNGKAGTGRGVRLATLFHGALADVDAVRNLPRLPETADELRMVAKEVGAGDDDLYLGERASEPILRKAALERFHIVEFATHGLMSGDLKGLAEPALVLTPPKMATPDNDGLLTASKVATLKLDADWVVLSACNTAADDGTPDAGGLSGLAQAFFYAGARALLVSHWSVPSEATVKLVTDTFDELKRDPAIGRAEALRRSEISMLDPSNPPEFAHPMMWAPFVLAGEGGAGR
jgi:CHAT domain-containing protein